MTRVTSLGRRILAVSLAALGLQQLILADFVPGPFVAPPWLPWRTFWAYLSASGTIIGAIGLTTRHAVREAAGLLALLLFLCVAAFHLSAPVAVLEDGSARTRAFETLALLGAALVLIGPPVAKPGRVVFALSLVVFGVQHFMYAAFVATLVPSWIPGGLFWTYLTGVAFIAAAAGILLNTHARLAAAVLGLMFLLWFIVLHAPRVALALDNRAEWNSALVALAMCGAAWIVAAAAPARPVSPSRSGSGFET